MEKHILVVCAIFALCMVNNANAIQCYKCKSTIDGGCTNEALDSATTSVKVVNCDDEPKPNTMEQYMPVTRCNKVVSSDKAGPIVSRDCHFQVVGTKPDVCAVSHNQQVDMCYICSGDKCNSSSSAGRFVALGLTAILAFVSMQFAL
ncbi:uncharacterized protein LOC106082727 [Stomoxys calcitrans]|uniref:uncharacterized protein LOC106082727 n=1 Tax=Stomoxys calcitrans TaxID=35570 RepID=UPI0027E22C4B|nr:uncharacterized protein LOC106082727 [Stomoxys calcitrans]